MMYIRGFIFFLGVLATLFLAWLGLTIIPGLQISEIEPPEGLAPYDIQEQRGRDIYVREGCVYCHSQQTRPEGFGADQDRNWGRPSVPGDYYYDNPHLLGTMRTGPDLLNIGARQPSEQWHMIHLYNPRATSPGSIMPSYPWLFELKDRFSEEVHRARGDRVIPVPDEYVPEGKVVVATQDAIDLVAYLLSLDRTYPAEDSGESNE